VDTIKDLKLVVENSLTRNGDSILGWRQENIFVIVSTLSGTNDVIIQNEDVPIIQYNIEPGSSIHILGNINCKSDAPKMCFKATYIPDGNMLADYFGCKECGYNWICASCAEVCHKGHTVSNFILGHKPTWGCCNCPKKNKRCLLFNDVKK